MGDTPANGRLLVMGGKGGGCSTKTQRKDIHFASKLTLPKGTLPGKIESRI
jgi:hypothetical protein